MCKRPRRLELAVAVPLAKFLEHHPGQLRDISTVLHHQNALVARLLINFFWGRKDVQLTVICRKVHANRGADSFLGINSRCRQTAS